MTHYNPKTIMRQVSKPLFREFIESRKQPLAADWTLTGEKLVQSLHDAFCRLSESARGQLELDMQDIHAVACEEGQRALVEAGNRHGVPLAGEFDSMENRYDRAVWVCLRHPAVWQAAVKCAHADSLPSRYWQKRTGLPRQIPDSTPAALAKLARSVSAFFVQAEARGGLCCVEPFQRTPNLHYFFAYLSNYPDTSGIWNDDRQLVCESRRHAFEVVYAFDSSAGSLDVYAHGGRKVMGPLQAVFAESMLGVHLDPDTADEMPYRVDGLKHRAFAFTTDPADGIREVAIRRLRLSVVGNPRKQLTVSLPDDGHPAAMYDSLENELNHKSLPLSILRVERAAITLKLEGRGRTRQLTFEVGPDSCNLKGKRDDLRELGEKYLRRWGIDAA